MTTEEKIEFGEQTPLKLDTDVSTPVEGLTTTEPGLPSAQVTQAKKNWWFRKGPKKTNAGDEKAANEEKEAGAEEMNGGAKKPHWWQRKPCKTTCGEGPTFGVDFVRRDEQQLHTAIDLGFSDIFGEPDAIHSFNGVWRVTNLVFIAVRSFFYKLFTIILCVPAAFVFGLLFALISALGVFVIVPAGRLVAIPTGWLFKLWSCIVINVLEPVAGGIAHLFSRIKIYKYGINNDPTATIGA